jgi:polyphosphate glucokinase
VTLVLAVDIGATTIKMQPFSLEGEPGRRSRRPTPYPCWPERLSELVARRALADEATHVGVGFPGRVEDGTVLDGANLTRATGPAGSVDENLRRRWNGFDLAEALGKLTGAAVVVHNDAAMAALGCATGERTELVVTLGTGCGLALVREGRLVPVRDLGDERLVGSETYDDVLGERGRRQDETRWSLYVIATLSELADQYGAGTIHLAGGNARRLSAHMFGDLAAHVVIERGEPALMGAWRACVRATS